MDSQSPISGRKQSFRAEENAFKKPRLLLSLSEHFFINRIFSWLHDGQPIDEKLGKYSRIGVDRSSLLIANLQSTDSGLYSCRSENADDATDASANIIVQTAPQIVKWPKSVRLQETMDVEVGISVLHFFTNTFCSLIAQSKEMPKSVGSRMESPSSPVNIS